MAFDDMKEDRFKDTDLGYQPDPGGGKKFMIVMAILFILLAIWGIIKIFIK